MTETVSFDLAYPSRCHTPPPAGAPLVRPGGGVRLHGRLIQVETNGGLLADSKGRTHNCLWAPTLETAAAGDIVEVEGEWRQEVLRVDRLRLLAPAVVPAGPGGWPGHAARQAQLRRMLLLRSAVLGAIRRFFARAGFLEVETPALVPAPGQEAHLQLFATTFSGRTPQDCFLVSSPEHHMKRLLGAGFDRIFQLGRAFRDGERTASHNPEFCMLEWYRAYASYEEMMEDVAALVAEVAREVTGSTTLRYQGRPLELAPPWPRLSVREAFGSFAGVDLVPGVGVEELRRQARRSCPSVDTADGWEEIFFKLLLEKVEPGMAAMGRAVLLTDYPASMAALAKVRRQALVAERVEAYAGGLELANGFTELNDPVEQRRRFAAERSKRRALGHRVHPLDEDFLRMLAQGMPPAGGMALGVDRLVMLLADAAHIDEVLPFPFALAESTV